MIQWVSEDLRFVEYDLAKSSRGKRYVKMWFVDNQTKRKIAVYDFSGLDSAAGTIKRFESSLGKDSSRWWLSGVVNTVGEKHFLVLQRFALLENGKKINPYRMEEGIAEVELVSL